MCVGASAHGAAMLDEGEENVQGDARVSAPSSCVSDSMFLKRLCGKHVRDDRRPTPTCPIDAWSLQPHRVFGEYARLSSSKRQKALMTVVIGGPLKPFL